MTSFATLQAQLPTLLAGVLEIPCQWGSQPLKVIEGAQAKLDVLAPTTLGEDEIRWADVPDPGDPETPLGVQATSVGNRELTLQVTVSSRNQELDGSARFYLERLRTRLAWPSVIEALAVLDVAVVRTEPMQDLEPTEDLRVTSETAMDIRLAYLSLEVEPMTPYIETAHISSTVKNAGGVVLPDVLQQDLDPPEP